MRLRATLDELHAGRLGAEHRAHVCIDGSGTPAGWVYFARDADSEIAWELFWIGVHPAQQRHGVGEALLDLVEVEVRNAGGLLLRIATSALPLLKPARTFYANRRYLEAARVADFYAVGDDKVVFEKRLN